MNVHYFQFLLEAFDMVLHANFSTGNADEAICLYRNALRVIKDSNNMSMDDGVMEKIRTDLAELLHVVGR